MCCRDCGCGADGGAAGHEHHDHLPHHHEPAGPAHRTVPVHQAILSRNDQLAESLRADFQARGLTVINVLSSPGSGKTELLVRTLAELSGLGVQAGVIVGDLATDNDARRLQATGAPVVQVNTGSVCHLEAAMVTRAAAQLDLDALDFLFLENVGNLVCPAAFDLGETRRVVLLSVTEGEDKPLKYPVAFRWADTVVLSKIDLAAAAGFDRAAALAYLQRAAPEATVFELSARTGAGLDDWFAALLATRPARASQLVL